MQIVLHKILCERNSSAAKNTMETSGLGFPSSSSALHLRVHTASPK